MVRIVPSSCLTTPSNGILLLLAAVGALPLTMLGGVSLLRHTVGVLLPLLVPSSRVTTPLNSIPLFLTMSSRCADYVTLWY
jgi:hypothetical protein